MGGNIIFLSDYGLVWIWFSVDMVQCMGWFSMDMIQGGYDLVWL